MRVSNSPPDNGGHAPTPVVYDRFVTVGMKRWFAGTVVMLPAFVSYGCGRWADDDESEPPKLPTEKNAAYSDATIETATERGLVAAILTHLDADDVKSAAFAVPDDGYEYPPGVEPAPGYVVVDLKVGMSIGLSVSGFMPERASSCADDMGYDAIQCSDEPYRFVGKRATAGGVPEDGPDYEGRTRSTDRGEVLIQIWTEQSRGDTVVLLDSLLDDPHLGVQTTAGLNALGKALKNVGTLDLRGTVIVD